MSRLREHFPLLPYNSFGLDVHARWWVELTSEREAIEFLMDHPPGLGKQQLILGGGSNLLFTRNFEGLVIKNNILGKEVVSENGQKVTLKVGAGENWHQLVQYCLKNDWGGIENLSLIPGSVGAAPIQNIGAYGIEVKEVFTRLEAIHLRTGNIQTFEAKDCQFGYRDSVFKRQYKGQYLITSVFLTLSKAPHKLNTSYGAIQSELKIAGIKAPSIQDISRIVCHIRQSKLPDPKEVGNGGSFFKNPVIEQVQFEKLQQGYPDIPSYPQANNQVKIPAAWLIQTAGWKGKRFGNYGVHPQQALVLVNYGGASGQDILDLSQEILEDVKGKFGIELEREVNIV